MLRRFLVVVGFAALGAGCAQNGSSVPPFSSGTVTPTASPSPSPSPRGISGTITEFASGGMTAPDQIVAGPDGNMWFSNGCGAQIGRITPSGTVTVYALPTPVAAPVGDIPTPSPPTPCIGSLAAGPDGNVWFTDFRTDHVGKITPAGAVTEFSAGISASATPWGIAAGPDGNLWFTEGDGGPPSYSAPRIGRITTSGAVTEFTQGLSAGTYPQGIVAGPDGNMWFAEYGHPGPPAPPGSGQLPPQNVGRIGRITMSGAVTEFAAGISNAGGPSRIAAGPDGNLWFTERELPKLGRITTTGAVTEFTLAPNAIAAGPDGNMWFTETSPDRIARITPAGVVTEFSNGITPGSNPTGIASGPGNTIWFVETAGNRIGRVQ